MIATADLIPEIFVIRVTTIEQTAMLLDWFDHFASHRPCWQRYCRHCGKAIGEISDPWGRNSYWIHNIQDGPDAYVYCGDRYGTNAEPLPIGGCRG